MNKLRMFLDSDGQAWREEYPGSAGWEQVDDVLRWATPHYLPRERVIREYGPVHEIFIGGEISE